VGSGSYIAAESEKWAKVIQFGASSQSDLNIPFGEWQQSPILHL
jgi:hypothetical protein